MAWVAEVPSFDALWGMRLENQGAAPVHGGGSRMAGEALPVGPVTSSAGRDGSR